MTLFNQLQILSIPKSYLYGNGHEFYFIIFFSVVTNFEVQSVIVIAFIYWPVNCASISLARGYFYPTINVLLTFRCSFELSSWSQVKIIVGIKNFLFFHSL